MATEKIQTELVITNLAHGQSSQQDLQSAIQAQQLLSTGPRKQLGQALAGSGALGDETQLLNALARMLRTRAGSTIRTTGTPVPTGRYRTNRQGEVMLDEAGEPIPEMQTPTVSARVRSDPNAHLSDTMRAMMKRRLQRKLLGAGDVNTSGLADVTPSAKEMSEFIERATSGDITEEGMLAFKYKAELFQQAKRDKKEVERFNAAKRRKELGLRTGLQTYDPETGLRTFQRPLSSEQLDIHSRRLVDPLASAEDKAESEFALKEEMRTRRERARSTRETSKYDEKALKDISQIEKDIEATRKRLDTGKMRERLDSANAKLDRPGFASMLRDVFRRAPIDFNVPLAGPVPQPRRPLTPEQAREQRFLDQNSALDDKVAAYRKMARDERVAPEGREALAEIKKDKEALKESATALANKQDGKSEEDEQERLRVRARAQRRQLVGDMFTDAGGSLFNPDKSIATTGVLGGVDKMAGYAQTAGALTGNPLMFIGATLVKTITQTLTAGLERGTELQKQAEKIYTDAEPVFAREEQMRAARGRTSVRSFSPEAQKRADAAQRKLGSPDLETAGSGTPEDEDVYSKTATTRFKALQRNLGSVMGLADASRAYQQFRRQSGVIDMSHDDVSLAMKTGFMAGTPQELLARASTLGAIQGNLGGGLRSGLDQRRDIGTIRYQQETLERAGLTGAPAEAILGQTLSRQEAFAAMGMRTDFDRDAKFQRVLQEQQIAPQQFGGITGTLDEMRTGLMQQLQAPGKEILSGLMMAEAFRRGKTVTGAASYLAKTSSAEILENQMTGVGPGSGLSPFVATALAPADQPAMLKALENIREGRTAGPAAATGSGTIDDAARGRGEQEFLGQYSAVGAQRDMGDKAKIAQFQSSLDSAARGMRAAADNMQALIANVNAIIPFGN